MRLDQYLTVAHFQLGVSNFLMGDFEEALANFNDALLYLRGNNHIDYGQLGLRFKLYSCEVLFNRGLCYIFLQKREEGMHDLSYAAKEKQVPDHDVIDRAITQGARAYRENSLCHRRWLTLVGLHCVLDTGRHRVQTERSQGQEFEDQRQPWQSTFGCRF